jgi:hypothetical protein
MKHTINSYGDYYHEIIVTLNGWITTWKWYGDCLELSHELIDYILDKSLEAYIEFCTVPDKYYYSPILEDW